MNVGSDMNVGNLFRERKMITLDFHGHKLQLVRGGAQDLYNEVMVHDNYKMLSSGLEFSPGDIILDIGANEGYFSIMMAVLFPVKVIAYEPTKKAFGFFMENLRNNNILNVEPHFTGISNEAGRKDLKEHPVYTTTSSAYVHAYAPNIETCDMITLDEAIGDKKIKLLKIDIEGGEYDALYPCTLLDRVEMVTGEFHSNEYLKSLGYTIDGLTNWLRERTKLGFIEPKELWP